jgi:DNA-binding Lrp family transcriptional regulator
LLAGLTNTQIASKTGKPLSTIQRRTRQIIESGFLKPTFEIDYSRLGMKKGLLHVYLDDGDIHLTAQKILHMDGVLAVSIHIGNSDVVADYACAHSSDLLNLIASVKKMPNVERVVWSEEVQKLVADGDNHARIGIVKDIQSIQEPWKE